MAEQFCQIKRSFAEHWRGRGGLLADTWWFGIEILPSSYSWHHLILDTHILHYTKLQFSPRDSSWIKFHVIIENKGEIGSLFACINYDTVVVFKLCISNWYNKHPIVLIVINITKVYSFSLSILSTMICVESLELQCLLYAMIVTKGYPHPIS